MIKGVDAGGTRLGEASLEWLPPEAGVYTISARAVDTQGNVGASSGVQITVGRIGSAVGGPTGTSTPGPLAAVLTGTPTPAALTDMTTSTPTPGPLVGMPTGTTSPALTITPVHPIMSLTPPTLPADTTPPEISSLLADPAILSAKVACGATPAITTVSATVTDAGVVQSVIARILGTGTEFGLAPVGGNVFQGALGPFDEATTLSILVIASDTAGNTSQAGLLTVPVVACPG
jgi:hypothetical protein